MYVIRSNCCHWPLQTLLALSCRQTQRSFSTNTEGEIRITKILKEKFPQASSLKVVDISGKCLYCPQPLIFDCELVYLCSSLLVLFQAAAERCTKSTLSQTTSEENE